MRNSEEIKRLIIDIARNDDRVRAVLLNGSRANEKISPDKYQDFDIIYIVNDIESLISDKNWTNIFGEKLIWQLPDQMVVGKKGPEKGGTFAILMLFTDGNRIDLTLLPKSEIRANYKADSLTIVWLDKDNMFSNIGLPDDSDYLVKEPTEKEFLDTCNEFWWVCTYVAKGLLRNEIIYSKDMLETGSETNVHERDCLAYWYRNEFFGFNWKRREVYKKLFTSRSVQANIANIFRPHLRE